MNVKWTVIGFQKLDYMSKKTNKRVQGYNLYLVREPAAYEDSFAGQICEARYYPSTYVDYVPQLGDQVVLLFNEYGKIGSIQVV